MNEPGPVSPGEILLKEFLEPANTTPGRRLKLSTPDSVSPGMLPLILS